jgi:hypothetical protein
MPGGTKLNNIIYATKTQWKSKNKLKHGVNDLICANYADKQDLVLAFNEYINMNGNSAH